MHAISAEADRRCCNDALMMPQNLLLTSAPNLMLFSSVPCLHNILQYTRTLLSKQGIMLHAGHEVLLFSAGGPCPTSMQSGAALHMNCCWHMVHHKHMCVQSLQGIYTRATKQKLLRPRQIQMKGNSLVKYGQNSLQGGAHLLGNRVVLLNICHHFLGHRPLLCSASDCSQSTMAFCSKRSNDDAVLTGHVGKQAILQ